MPTSLTGVRNTCCLVSGTGTFFRKDCDTASPVGRRGAGRRLLLAGLWPGGHAPPQVGRPGGRRLRQAAGPAPCRRCVPGGGGGLSADAAARAAVAVPGLAAAEGRCPAARLCARVCPGRGDLLGRQRGHHARGPGALFHLVVGSRTTLPRHEEFFSNSPGLALYLCEGVTQTETLGLCLK